MIANSTLRVGGNSLLVWFGKVLESTGKKVSTMGTNLVQRGSPKFVTNPTGKLYNPFTLMISFTVNGCDKYQIILQGDFKQRYINQQSNEGILDISENELFMIINQNQEIWFKKEVKYGED